ncbi:anti-sigma-I factor RsgI family protein [Clostridium beijerinckii]|uniref:anti-sigma-I factor RsgI family protein n=1 Tax=Clostridium beijerinckii TaxID=1520 RepID=UPI001494CF5E|nr:hypothetical protein [Clostridium beijerinckii]NOW02894.1 hypothetical protein [Clostridium beijerinckii]NYC03965.1 hypothetical protein [Clostridium beijerinckii]
MENKLVEKLDDLNISDTDLLLSKDIKLSLDDITIKRIEKLVGKKTGYYKSNNIFKEKINYILGGIYMKRKIALVLSVVALSSLGGGVYAHAKTTPVAYVSVDINPSIELSVNTFDQVISAESYNEDGKKVLEDTNLVNSDVDDAVKYIITNAVSDGYIKEDGTSAVEITTATDKDNVATKLDESLKQVADKSLEENNIEATVETQDVALSRRDEARKLGITPGKLNLIQKLQELDPTINVEDYKSSSVKDIQKKTKELKKINNNEETTVKDDANTGGNVEGDTNQDAVAEEKISNSSSKSNGNGSIKKEENSDSSSKKEENATEVEKSKDNSAKTQKQSDNGNSNSQNGNKDKNKNN